MEKEPPTKHLVHLCFWYVYQLVSLTLFLSWLSGALVGVGGSDLIGEVRAKIAELLNIKRDFHWTPSGEPLV